MTDEQLEKQISEEFEKWWEDDKDIPEILGRASEKVKAVTNMSERCSLLSEFWAEEAFKTAALPLMKKIEESKYYYLGREVTKEFLAELISGWCAETVKLQKENEELRTSLSHSLLDLEIYSNMHGYNYWNAIAPEIRTKFNLDKNDKGAV